MTAALVGFIVVQTILNVYFVWCIVNHNERLEWVEQRTHSSHSFGEAVWNSKDRRERGLVK